MCFWGSVVTETPPELGVMGFWDVGAAEDVDMDVDGCPHRPTDRFQQLS